MWRMRCRNVFMLGELEKSLIWSFRVIREIPVIASNRHPTLSFSCFKVSGLDACTMEGVGRRKKFSLIEAVCCAGNFVVSGTEEAYDALAQVQI